jgi:hypothetical protein
LSWIRTGEALQAVWLWAAGNGLALVPHSQVVELPTTRRRLQDELFDDTACPQLVVRLGWAPAAEHEATEGADTAMTSARVGEGTA